MSTVKPRRKVALARQLRKAMTDPEYLLWQRLKTRDGEVVFKRQKPFGPYILDFYCFAARLAVEVDGGIHGDEANYRRDCIRDAYLTAQGLYVYRISAADVYRQVDEIADGVRLLAEGLARERQ